MNAYFIHFRKSGLIIDKILYKDPIIAIVKVIMKAFYHFYFLQLVFVLGKEYNTVLYSLVLGKIFTRNIPGKILL